MAEYDGIRRIRPLLRAPKCSACGRPWRLRFGWEQDELQIGRRGGRIVTNSVCGQCAPTLPEAATLLTEHAPP